MRQDELLERWVGRFLGFASTGSASLLALGLAARAAGAAPGFAAQAVHAGLLALLLTPVARVALAGALYVRNREWAAVGFSAAVLVVLAVAYGLGGLER